MINNSLMINRIKQRMNEVGINAKQLAEKAEVGKSFVYDILNGKSKNPTSNKLSSISKHLGIPISYLINVDENNDIDLQRYIPIHPLQEEGDENNSDTEQHPSMLLISSLLKQNTNHSSFYSFTITDDSMVPTFNNGDIVILSISTKKQKPSGFFLIKDDFSTTIRRIEHIIGSIKLRIVADNEKYATYQQEIDNIQLIGKVIWHLRTV